MLQQLAVYIHWPFCKFKCPYCDFNSHVREGIDQSDWLKSYIDELRFYHDLVGERELVSIFFGGGTPSLMETSTVASILEEVDKLWGIPQGIEVTLEANPTSVEVEKFKGFKSAGVNRVSLGIQSLRDADLKALGRQHSVEEALVALKTASSVFGRFSFDLIYAREGQTLPEWKEELNEALQYQGGHLSMYQLTIEEGTKFHTLHQRGELVIPEEDTAADMYELTQEVTDKHGLPAYEVSNHARLGDESQHNLVYWNYGDYVGIGAGAHGRITVDGEKLATRNHKAPEIWREGKRTMDAVSYEQQLYERLMMGLRLAEGIEWQNDFDQVIKQDKLKVLVDEGFVLRDGKRIKVTPSGMQRLNAVLGYML